MSRSKQKKDAEQESNAQAVVKPAVSPVQPERCTACGGTGNASKGGTCVACSGKGGVVKAPDAKKDEKKAEKKAEKQEPAIAKPKPKEDPVPKHIREKSPTALTFTPRAWAKLAYMRDRGTSEVSGFGISHPNDPMLITDFRLVEQINTSTFTEFVDKALANYVEDMAINEKIGPARCFRVWIHTHPNMSPTPSGHDESTFARVNGESSWGVMCVVADTKEYARLIVNNAEGMSVQRELSVRLGLYTPFDAVTEDDYKAWEQEYLDKVSVRSYDLSSSSSGFGAYGYEYGSRWGCWDDMPGEAGINDQASDDAADDIEDLEYFIEGEVVQAMNHGPDGFCYLFTDNLWLAYGSEHEVMCDIGDTLMRVSDAGRFPPHDWGQVEWSDNAEPIMRTRFGDDPADVELSTSVEEDEITEEEERVLAEITN